MPKTHVCPRCGAPMRCASPHCTFPKYLLCEACVRDDEAEDRRLAKLYGPAVPMRAEA